MTKKTFLRGMSALALAFSFSFVLAACNHDGSPAIPGPGPQPGPTPDPPLKLTGTQWHVIVPDTPWPARHRICFGIYPDPAGRFVYQEMPYIDTIRGSYVQNGWTFTTTADNGEVLTGTINGNNQSITWKNLTFQPGDLP